METKIQATNVLRRTIEAEKKYKIICHQGGSRSSKTWSIFQFFILKALQGERLTITIVRDKLTWIKSTLLKDFEKICREYSLPITPDININRPEQIYNICGTEFAFYGLDYAEKLHGRSQDWFWINEVMEVSQKHFDQLEMRASKGAILDYNPYDDLHWVFDLHKRDDVCVIKSTMLDNPFLPDTIIKKIKGYEPTPENIASGTSDEYMWQVYGLGNKARLQGVIFDNWDIVDDIPDNAKFVAMGLDFGYTNDPTAVVELYTMDNELYFNEILYEAGLTNQDIAKKLVNKTDMIYADSSEPKSIEEIRREGYRIFPTEKGADSINYGINLMKQHKIHITKNSTNLEKELRRYRWMEKKEGGVENRPVDEFNHAIDACRYVCMMKLGRSIDIPIFSM